MKKTLTLVVAALAALCSPAVAFSAGPGSASAETPADSSTEISRTSETTDRAQGFRVSGGRLYEANGAEFVMRGVNHAHTWYQSETDSFAHIKALGANTVRVVLASGQRWTENSTADVANVISLCKQNRLICVLEVHDTTGYGEQSGAASLAQAVDYWLRVRSALVGQEQYVIVNIGNEPFGNTGYAAWTQDTSAAIQRLRSAGFEHTLMVDAPNWGQDWTFTMRDNAASVFNADPQRNTMFSVHMYGVFDTAAEITDYIGRFVSAGLPILVGEFGHNHSDGNPDEDAIMATAEAQRIGYLGWSWSGNGGGVEYLDMVTSFDPAQLTSWGERIFNGPNGIRQTSREATVFGGGTPDTTAPTAPGAPEATATTAASVTLAWPAATDDTGVSAYEVVRVTGTAETAAVTSTSATATVTGLSAATSYTFAVYARDAAGNRSPRSATVTVTTEAAGSGACAASYRLVEEWAGGFQAEVTVVNSGTSQIDGWRLEWTFPAGQTVTNMWHAVPAQDGAAVVATNVDYNRLIPPGGSVTIGFTGSWTSDNPAPEAVALNGARCSAG